MFSFMKQLLATINSIYARPLSQLNSRPSVGNKELSEESIEAERCYAVRSNSFTPRFIYLFVKQEYVKK